MKENINEIYIRDNLLFTHEVCDMLGVSKQQVSNLVRQGKIRPIKETPKAAVFLKAEIDEYLAKKHSLPINKEEIIGQHCTHYSMQHFESIANRHKDVTAVHVYQNETDAILDGYYSYAYRYQRDALLPLAAPTCVLVFNDGTKVYYDGCNCGYCGTGPRGSEEILLSLGVTEEAAAKVLSFKKISYYKTNDGWDWVNREGTNELEVEEIGLYNDSFVLITHRNILNKEEENYGKLLEKYEFFIPRPQEVCILSYDEAVKTGHYSNIPYNRGVYRLIIKDFSGNELWLKAPMDEEHPVIRQINLETALKQIGFEIPEDKKASLPDKIKVWLGLTPIVADRVVYNKPQR